MTENATTVTVTPRLTHFIESPPSCLSFVPGLPQTFIVGKYLLHTSTDESSGEAKGQRRTGGLEVFEIDGEKLVSYQNYLLDYAVLDFQFEPSHHETGAIKLAVAGSTGSIELFEFNQKDKQLRPIVSCSVASHEILTLSLDWAASAPHSSILVFTLSDGRVGVAMIGQSQNEQASAFPRACESARYFHVHDLEAWTAVWSACKLAPYDSGSILSGGDDAAICQIPIEASDGIAGKSDPIAPVLVVSNRKLHDAGVIAILSLAEDGEGDLLVLSGSYDEHLRLLKRSQARRQWQLVDSIRLGGGVWRLKILKQSFEEAQALPSEFLILACCMHAGPRVVSLRRSTSAQWTFEVQGQLLTHESMNYASDAEPMQNLNTSWIVVSSSFYDKRICIWDWPPKS